MPRLPEHYEPAPQGVQPRCILMFCELLYSCCFLPCCPSLGLASWCSFTSVVDTKLVYTEINKESAVTESLPSSYADEIKFHCRILRPILRLSWCNLMYAWLGRFLTTALLSVSGSMVRQGVACTRGACVRPLLSALHGPSLILVDGARS